MSQVPNQNKMNIPTSIYDMEEFDAKKYDEFFAIPKDKKDKIAKDLYEALGLESWQGKISILSIGVGTGRLDIPFLRLLCQQSKRIHYVAVEPSEKMLARFREKLTKIGFKRSNSTEFKNSEVKVEIQVNAFSLESSDNLKPPNNAGGFDVILALFVLHATPNWQDAFLGMFKLLKPGGSIALAEECGDVQWLDNRLVNMERVRQIWQNIENDKEAKSRWFHYRFWQEYHRIRRDMLGKGWDPEISATDLGPIKAALSELAELGYGRWRALEPPIDWEGKLITINTLLKWVGGEHILFTPLLLWGLKRQDLRDLKQCLNKWTNKQGLGDAFQIPRTEGHKFYIYQKPNPEPDEFQKRLCYLLRKSRLASQRLVERIDYNKIEIGRKQVNEEKEKKYIYSHACNRLSLLYQQHFRGQEPIGLAYISWDIVKEEWRTPLPILIAGIPSDKIIEFVASYALYPLFQFTEKESLSLNQLMLRDMPETFIFRIRRVESSNQLDVKPASYRKSGRPIFVEIKVPIELNGEIKEVLQELKGKLYKAIAARISGNLPVVGNVAIVNYEDFLEQAKSRAQSHTDLHKKLDIAFRPLEQKLVDKFKEKKLFQFFKDAYAWTNYTKLEDKLAHLLPRVFLIGATTDNWLQEIQWIAGKGILEDDREQAFGGIIVLNLADKAKAEDDTSEEELNELTLVQTLESSLDGIREQSRYVRYQVLSGGTRSAVTTLVGRNLSHHSGSHILHWLEQEAREQAKEVERMANAATDTNREMHSLGMAQYFKSKALFYAYMRERMDLVAGMAVYLPTWTVTTSLNDLIAGINPQDQRGDSLVLRHIGQSEGVYWADVVPRQEDKKKELAIPGSAMGKQAFCGLLENIARDAAKYGDIQSDRVVIVTKIMGSPPQWNKHSRSGKFPTCWHFDAEPSFQMTEIKNKFQNQESRTLVVQIAQGRQCQTLRQLWREKELGANFIVWSVNIIQDCRHRLCKVVRELIEKLQKNKSSQVCEKARELDRALLSITVEISDLDNSCSEIDDEKWGMLDYENKQQRMQEVKENLYRVVIYDDRSSFSQNEARISEAIKGFEQEGLCDESGRLRPGNWGIKERYIFATYLRGEKPEYWLLPENMRPERTAIPPILRVKNCSGKLGWVFYMLKPKDILIVRNTHSQDEVPEEKRQRINVWTWDDLQQRLGSSLLRHKFVILCPKDDNQVKKIKYILDYLPYRVFIYNKNGLTLPKCIKQHCALLDEDKFGISTLDLWQLYEKWVNFVAQRFNQCVLNVLSIAGRGNTGYVGEQITGSTQVEQWIGQKNPKCIALFDRHGTFAGKVKNGDMTFLHYEPFEGGWSAESGSDFAQNSSLQSVYHTSKILLQEAALIRILVVDERIDGSLGIKERFDTDVTHRELWAWKGVDIMGQDYKGRGQEIPNEQRILQRIEKARSENHPYGFVLLHQGILDKLYDNLSDEQKKKQTKQEYVEGIIERIQGESVWHVIIHSGRGGVPDLPKGVKFIHLSCVEAWFGSNLSKADVIDELMSARRDQQ